MTPAAAAVDHLIIGVPDLDAGIAWAEKATGVRPAVGGSHPGRGTRNVLMALAARQYIEIMGPDPTQNVPRAELRDLREPRLIGWAAAATDIGALSARVRGTGLSTSGPRPGSRARPDGRMVHWTTLGMETGFAADAVDPIPFFIAWDPASVHPSQDSPKGSELTTLEFEHPDADGLRRTFRQLGIEAPVRTGTAARIMATLKTPKGSVTLS